MVKSYKSVDTPTGETKQVGCAVGEYVQIRLPTESVHVRRAKKVIERSKVTFIDSALIGVQNELKTPGTDKMLVTLKITLHLRADFVRVENINAPERSTTRKSTASANNTLINLLMEQQATATNPNNDSTLALAIQCAQKFTEKERRRTEMVRQTTLTSQSTAVDKMLHAVQTSRQWEWDKGQACWELFAR